MLGADVLNLFFLYDFSMYRKCYGLIKQHIYRFFLNLFYPKDSVIVCEDLDVLLFLEIINIVSIRFYNFIEFITLLDTFLVNSFPRYKKYMTYLISFSKFSDVLPAFTCAKDIGNF